MNNIEYGGLYFTDNPISIGRIYLRFFCNGLIAYSIISDIKTNDNIFNMLQNNYNKNIDLVEFNINNNLIELFLNTEIGVLKLTGNINNDTLIINIINTMSNEIIGKDVIFIFYKKHYTYDHHKNNTTKIKENEKLKAKIITCENCSGIEFTNYRISNNKNEYIGFICKICKTSFIYENNTINVLHNNRKEKTNKEYIPGSPQMARSLNGFAYRSIAKWGNKT
jgi:hypothetical protein